MSIRLPRVFPSPHVLSPERSERDRLRDFDALVAFLRENTTAREWLYELSTLERQMLATAAAGQAGTEPLEPDTVVVRRAYNALLFPPREPVGVLLGEGTCVECGTEEVEDRCPDPSCAKNAPRPAYGTRDHRGWLRTP